MANYHLIGSSSDDELSLENLAEGTVCAVPREVWEEVVSMFQAGDAKTRRTAAEDMLAEVETARMEGSPMRIALEGNHLADVLVTVRIEAIERAMERSPALEAVIGRHVAYDRAAA
jgi:hypothetical protein